MRRRVLLAVLFALLFLGLLVTVFLFLATGGLGPSGPGAGVRAPTGEEALAGDGESRAEVASEAVDEPGEDAGASSTEDVLIEEVPPLLRGQVVGEGVGVPGATVLFFGVHRVEALLLRLERLAPQGGEFPDVPAIVASLRDELRRFRAGAEEVRTDQDGFFELRDVRPEAYVLLVVADGWLFRYGDVVSLDVDRTEEITLELERGSVIAGRVARPTGSGVPGAFVLAEYRPQGIRGVGRIAHRLLSLVNGEFLRGPFEASTDAGGRFTFTSLPAGIYDIVARGPEGVEGRLGSVATGTEDAVVLVGPGARVGGRLVDTESVPVPSVPIRLERVEDLAALPAMFASWGGVLDSVNRMLGEPPRDTVSLPDGSFAFRGLSAGEWELSIDAPGFLPFSRRFRSEWGADTMLGEIVLDRGGIVLGTVRTEDGTPLEGAMVFAWSGSGNPLGAGAAVEDFLSGRVRVRTRTDGSFALGGLREGRMRIVARYPGFAPATETDVELGGEPLELVLKPGVTLSGAVRDARTREPLEDARVRAGESRATTDAEGKFVLEGVIARDRPWGQRGRRLGRDAGDTPESGDADLGERQVRFRVEKKGYLAAVTTVDLDLPPADLLVELEPAPALQGIVLDPDGRPAPAALVRLAPWMPDQLGQMGIFDPSLIFLAVTVSDLEGRFRFEGFPTAASDRYRIMADHIEWARGRSDDFSLVGHDPSRDITVELVRGASIHGTVVTGAEPISGAAVRLGKARELDARAEMFIGMLGLPRGGTVTHSNSRGEFRYESVLPGTYELTAEMAGFTEGSTETIVLAEGETREVTFVMDPGGTIRGVVLDQLGAGVAGVRVRLLKEEAGRRLLDAQKFLGGAFRSARTDATGAFVFDGLPDGTYTAVASKEGYSQAEAELLRAGAEGVELVLVESASLRGVVRDAFGEPVRTFRLRVEKKGVAAGRRWMSRRSKDVNDAAGAFFEKGLEAGDYEVALSARGLVPVVTEVRLEAGAVEEREFQLARAGRIRGRIVHAETAAPIAGARVGLVVEEPAGEDAAAGNAAERTEEGDRRSAGDYLLSLSGGDTVSTGGDGTFLLDGAPPEPRTLVVTHPEFVTLARRDVVVAAGEEAEVTLRLYPGLSVSGRVVHSSGAPAAGRFVFVRGVGEGTRGVRKSATADPDGNFRIAGLGEGAYRIVSPAREPGDSSEAFEVELTRDVDGLEIRVP